MVFSSDYGVQLRRLRLSRSVSQMQLELDAELAFGTISRIENFHINPTKETLFKIASVLELSQREILELLGIRITTAKGIAGGGLNKATNYGILN